MYKLFGSIHHIGEIKKSSNNTLYIDLVLKTLANKPQYLTIRFFKPDLIKNCIVGNKVEINTQILGTEWLNKEGNTKYCNTLKGLNISVENEQELKKIPEIRITLPKNIFECKEIKLILIRET